MSNWLGDILVLMASYTTLVNNQAMASNTPKELDDADRNFEGAIDNAENAIQDHIRKAIGEDEEPDDDYEQCRDARNELRAEIRKELGL